MSTSPIASDRDDRPLASTSVRLTRREYMRLLSQLDRAAGPQRKACAANNRRRQQRMPFHRQAHLLCELGDHGARPAQYLVRSRNICKRGMAFLHESAIPLGTPCGITVIGTRHQAYQITGTIARSTAIAQGVYEIGIEFDRAIDPQLLAAHRSDDDALSLPAADEAALPRQRHRAGLGGHCPPRRDWGVIREGGTRH